MRHQNRITELHKRKIKFSLRNGQTTGGYHVKEMVRKNKIQNETKSLRET